MLLALSGEVARFLDADVMASRRSCPGEAVTVVIQPAPVNPAAVARIVSLAAASCFGQPGQNAYLVAKGPRSWKKVLSAEPGFIEVQATRHLGYADLALASLGTGSFKHR